MDYRDKIKYLEAELASLKTIRQTYEPGWADILDHEAPDLKGYLVTDQKDDGSKKDELIYDDHPKECAIKCASGIWASNSSPSRPWMMRKMKSRRFTEVQSAKAWTDDVTAEDMDNLQDSDTSFYASMYNAYLQFVTIGTTVIIVDKDYDSIYNFITLNVGEYWLGINGKNKYDKLYREFKMSVQQMVEVFGEENVPKKLLLLMTDNNPTGGEHTIVHVIRPDDDLRIAPFKKKWVSAYWLSGQHEGQFLEMKGYFRKPFAAAPYFRLHGETYGKLNPGRNMLSNCKQLQAMVYDYNKAVQMVIDPPTQSSAELLANNQVNSIPGGHTIISPQQLGEKIEALHAIRPDIAAMWQAIQDKKDQISSGFLIDLFMAMGARMSKDMTAEEVREIVREQTLALAPALDNLQQLLNELLDIVFDYSIEAGVYPEPPEEIQGEEIKVDYVSMLAQTQKMTDISRIDQVLFYVERIVQYYPEILHKVNLDQIIDEISDMLGAPASIINDDERVQQIRDTVAQQQQAAQLAQTATVAADVGSKMSGMDMSGDNALTRTMDAMGVA
jgi:hypothetical protein